MYCKGGKKRNPQLDGLSVVLVPTFYVCPSHQDCFLVSSKHNQTIDLHGSVRGIFLLKSLSFSWNIPACHTSNNLNDYHQGTGESILVNPFHGLCCIHWKHCGSFPCTNVQRWTIYIIKWKEHIYRTVISCNKNIFFKFKYIKEDLRSNMATCRE